MNNESQEEYGIPIQRIPDDELGAIEKLKQLNEQSKRLVAVKDFGHLKELLGQKDEHEAKDKSEQLNKLLEQKISLSSWETSSGAVPVDKTVIALLVQNQGGVGNVRITGMRNRYMSIKQIPRTESRLVILKSDERFLLLGSPSIRYFRTAQEV